MTQPTDNSDLHGAVFHATYAALEGWPGVDRGRIGELAEGVAECVVDRLEQLASFVAPSGNRYWQDVKGHLVYEYDNERWHEDGTPACMEEIEVNGYFGGET